MSTLKKMFGLAIGRARNSLVGLIVKWWMKSEAIFFELWRITFVIIIYIVVEFVRRRWTISAYDATCRRRRRAVAKISIVIFHNFAVHRMQLCVHVTYTHRKMKLIIIIYVHKIQLILRTPCVAADAYNKRRTNWRCRRHVCAFDGWASYDFVGAFVFFFNKFHLLGQGVFVYMFSLFVL